VTESHRGLAYGLGAYVIWGTFPLYFTLLEPTSPVEVLANRILWSCVVLFGLVIIGRRWSAIAPVLRDRRQLVLLAAASVMIAVNWGFFIYGVTSNQVVQTSLGYFINPLVSVVFGVVLLHERLRRTQWVAVGLGVAAVAVLSFDYGQVPWIALVLALSFGSYGLLKKVLDMGAVESLSVETALLTPLAAVYLGYLVATGTSAWGTGNTSMMLLLASTGVVTIVPLLLFSAAATRIPLTWIGLLQYTTPVLQFATGVFILNEPMPASRWVGFSLVWIALVTLAVDTAAAVRRGRARTQLEITERAQEAH
jgi:chloramphenicol-sensitive protein RarD